MAEFLHAGWMTIYVYISSFSYLGGSDKSEPPVQIFRGASAISPQNPYFELSIVNGGSKGTISIGLVTETFKAMSQLGRESGSIGWHADDGK